MLVLIGESGAGKTTIGLAALAYGRGGVRITGGEVLLDGEDIRSLGSGIRSIRGNRVCYVAQSAAAAFNPAHRLGDPVVEAAVRHGKLTRAKALERARYLFGVLGLPYPAHFRPRYPPHVSGGQLQRAINPPATCTAQA